MNTPLDETPDRPADQPLFYTLSQDAILTHLFEAVATTIGEDVEFIQPSHHIGADLGMHSIDVLNLRYQLEKTMKIKGLADSSILLRRPDGNPDVTVGEIAEKLIAAQEARSVSAY